MPVMDFWAHAPGTSGVADPLNTLGTVGFKASLAVKILNDAFLERIESWDQVA